MAIIIRRAEQKDEANFIDLSLELSRFNQLNHPIPEEPFEAVLQARREKAAQHFAKRDQEQHMILLAEFEGEAVGYAFATIQSPEPSSSRGAHVSGYLDEVFVLDKARGHRIGKLLLEAVTQWMKEQGAERMTLFMFNWNSHAQGFYEKENFRPYVTGFEREI
ncbi:MAG: N-acetyltransferase family protein [Tumebacillaceae bacterium]